MRASTWLRALAVLLALFAVGHTLGTAFPRVTRGPAEASVFDGMQAFRFPILGFVRSHWDFYRGFAISVSILLAALAVLAWQVATLSRDHPREALPQVVILLFACLGLTLVSWRFFFAPPLIMASVATVISLLAVISTLRQGRDGETVFPLPGKRASSASLSRSG